jgi:hypothetical protein
MLVGPLLAPLNKVLGIPRVSWLPPLPTTTAVLHLRLSAYTRNPCHPLVQLQERASRHLTEGLKTNPMPRMLNLDRLAPVILSRCPSVTGLQRPWYV